ncbi:conserved hypothetical protein [Flavobacterium psychrophilum]|nr:hypothetical protein [Flavobacterium psychrophilum]MCB6117296.1 hypothetical protein [Flavobacterium psychrophilum]MEB3390407.1 hypothetical protein [Flavobacterium psychrophilum]SNA31630.1 conserved hypothetical protein [Flavobacterium psychrophilum]SNA64807.1 conserved hypothetical protein [Flavobacterium psychrophilum]SNA80167.1 conserved hypothetical protein [Flavobacterium psychrophilum]
MTYEKPFYIGIAGNNYELKSTQMKLFILYQTDVWKSKTSRICFGVFDSRYKAIDSAKYNNLYCSCAEVVIEEVTLNLFEEN